MVAGGVTTAGEGASPSGFDGPNDAVPPPIELDAKQQQNRIWLLSFPRSGTNSARLPPLTGHKQNSVASSFGKQGTNGRLAVQIWPLHIKAWAAHWEIAAVAVQPAPGGWGRQ